MITDRLKGSQKNNTKQLEFCIRMDSGCLIFSGIVGDYKNEYIVKRQPSLRQLLTVQLL